MNKKQLSIQLKKVGKSDEFFAMTYIRQDADAQLKVLDEYVDHPPLTDEEWQKVVKFMNHDDAVWQETYNAFHYYVQRVLEQRAK